MPTIGAVIVLPPDTSAESTLARLRDDPRVTLGEPQGPRHPLVVETSTKREDTAFWDVLRQDPAVLNIELAFAEFSDLTTSAPARKTP